MGLWVLWWGKAYVKYFCVRILFVFFFFFSVWLLLMLYIVTKVMGFGMGWLEWVGMGFLCFDLLVVFYTVHTCLWE